MPHTYVCVYLSYVSENRSVYVLELWIGPKISLWSVLSNPIKKNPVQYQNLSKPKIESERCEFS